MFSITAVYEFSSGLSHLHPRSLHLEQGSPTSGSWAGGRGVFRVLWGMASAMNGIFQAFACPPPPGNTTEPAKGTFFPYRSSGSVQVVAEWGGMIGQASRHHDITTLRGAPWASFHPGTPLVRPQYYARLFRIKNHYRNGAYFQVSVDRTTASDTEPILKCKPEFHARNEVQTDWVFLAKAIWGCFFPLKQTLLSQN